MKVRLLFCMIFAFFTVACYSSGRSGYVSRFEGSSDLQELYEQYENSNLENVDYDDNGENSDLANGFSEDGAHEGDGPIFNSQVETFDNSGMVCDLVLDISANINMIQTQEIFEQGNISITYPQFESSEDIEKIQELNELIMDTALSVLDPLGEYIDDFTKDITYRISLHTNDFISIIFEGYSNMVGAAGPNLMFYTLNVDLETMQKIRLTDVVHVDEGFANLLLNGEFTPVNPDQIVVLEGFDTERMLERLLDADSREAYSYFTEDKLGISLVVQRVLGHYARFEILFTNENIQYQYGFKGNFGT